MPFQYSLHVIDSAGKRPRHHSFISDGSTDPRPEILSRLSGLIGKRGSIVAFNAAFETAVLKSCVGHFPEFTGWFESVRPRVVDLYSPFRDFHYYHPDQDGSDQRQLHFPEGSVIVAHQEMYPQSKR